MENSDQTTPVIVGVGQLIDRPLEHEDGFEPLTLILKAIELADRDSGNFFLDKIDSLDVENVSSWPYDDLEKLICNKLNINPKHCKYHEVSGDSPVRSICKAAQKIALGKSQAALICGAESGWTVRRNLKKNHIPASWTLASTKDKQPIIDLPEFIKKYGLDIPSTNYALYENAYNHKMGLDVSEAQNQTGNLWARASEIANNNPYAWIHNPHTSEEIVNATPENRMVAWPYTKLMVANNFVNGGTAVILTNLALAKQAGIPADKIIYCVSGGFANETDNILERDNYYHSAAMEAVLNAVVKNKKVDFIELYSCFPIVPKLAKQILNWPTNKDLSLIGGMTFCGGQLSNFMGQATVSMVEELRKSHGNGVLYGNGHFLTHAAAILLSTIKPISFTTELDYQKEADALKDKVPEYITEYEGKATIETFTVIFDSKGNPDHSLVIATSDEGKRFIAKTANGDTKSLQVFLNKEKSPIGMTGLSKLEQNFNIWRWD